MKPLNGGRTVAVILTAALCFTMLPACSSQQSSSSNTTGSKSAPSSSGPLSKYSPEINVSFIRGLDDDLEANVLPKCPGETIENNRWTKLYKDTLGINLTYDWTVRGDEQSDAFKQKINVTLASGQLPDYTVVTPAQLKQLVDADQVEDMTKYFAEYATPQLKSITTEEGQANINNVTYDGKMMGMPEPASFEESAQYIWIRNDWLKKLNLQPPKTMDDLLNIAKAFTTKDPDGNGKNDTYGLPIIKSLYNGCMGTEGFFAGYHAYPNMWVKDSSGQLVWGSIQPAVKTALQQLANLYSAGEIDKEFGVKTADKVAELIASGKYGIDFGQQWNPMYPLISNYNNDNKADWTGYSLVSADNQKVMVPLNPSNPRVFAVKKGMEHPEAIVKMFNLYAKFNASSGSTFHKYNQPPENGNVGVWKFSPVTPSDPLTNIKAFKEIEKARETKNFNNLSGYAEGNNTNVEKFLKGDKAQWGWYKIYGPDGVFKNYVEYQKNDELLYNQFVGAPTQTMIHKKSSLDQMENEEFVKIIMGQVPVSDFDKFVSNWNKMGGAQITKEVNDWYKTINKS